MQINTYNSPAWNGASPPSPNLNVSISMPYGNYGSPGLGHADMNSARCGPENGSANGQGFGGFLAAFQSNFGCGPEGQSQQGGMAVGMLVGFGQQAQPQGQNDCCHHHHHHCEAEAPPKKAAKKKRKKSSSGGPLNVSAMNAIAAGQLPGAAKISIPQQLKNMGRA